MSTAAPDKLMTFEEFEALPDAPKVERMPIRSVLCERPIIWRNKWQSATESLLVHRLVE